MLFRSAQVEASRGGAAQLSQGFAGSRGRPAPKPGGGGGGGEGAYWFDLAVARQFALETGLPVPGLPGDEFAMPDDGFFSNEAEERARAAFGSEEMFNKRFAEAVAREHREAGYQAERREKRASAHAAQERRALLRELQGKQGESRNSVLRKDARSRAHAAEFKFADASARVRFGLHGLGRHMLQVLLDDPAYGGPGEFSKSDDRAGLLGWSRFLGSALDGALDALDDEIDALEDQLDATPETADDDPSDPNSAAGLKELIKAKREAKEALEEARDLIRRAERAAKYGLLGKSREMLDRASRLIDTWLELTFDEQRGGAMVSHVGDDAPIGGPLGNGTGLPGDEAVHPCSCAHVGSRCRDLEYEGKCVAAGGVPECKCEPWWSIDVSDEDGDDTGTGDDDGNGTAGGSKGKVPDGLGTGAGGSRVDPERGDDGAVDDSEAGVEAESVEPISGPPELDPPLPSLEFDDPEIQGLFERIYRKRWREISRRIWQRLAEGRFEPFKVGRLSRDERERFWVQVRDAVADHVQASALAAVYAIRVAARDAELGTSAADARGREYITLRLAELDWIQALEAFNAMRAAGVASLYDAAAVIGAAERADYIARAIDWPVQGFYGATTFALPSIDSVYNRYRSLYYSRGIVPLYSDEIDRFGLEGVGAARSAKQHSAAVVGLLADVVRAEHRVDSGVVKHLLHEKMSKMTWEEIALFGLGILATGAVGHLAGAAIVSAYLTEASVIVQGLVYGASAGALSGMLFNLLSQAASVEDFDWGGLARETSMSAGLGALLGALSLPAGLREQVNRLRAGAIAPVSSRPGLAATRDELTEGLRSLIRLTRNAGSGARLTIRQSARQRSWMFQDPARWQQLVDKLRRLAVAIGSGRVVTPGGRVARESRKALLRQLQDLYRASNGVSPPDDWVQRVSGILGSESVDVDHVLELALGGDSALLQLLDSSVNRSVGGSIGAALRRAGIDASSEQVLISELRYVDRVTGRSVLSLRAIDAWAGLNPTLSSTYRYLGAEFVNEGERLVLRVIIESKAK